MGTETATRPAQAAKESTRTPSTPENPGDAGQDKKFAGARKLAGKLRGMLHRDRNGEATNSEAVLKDLRDSSEVPKKYRISEMWKGATKRNAGRLLRRELNSDADAWQKNPAHKDDVEQRYNKLKGDRTEISGRERFRLRARSIAESMNANTDTATKNESGQKEKKRTAKDIKASDTYKTEVSQRMDIKTSETGRPVGKIEEYKIRRKVLYDTLNADKIAAQEKTREEAKVKVEQQRKEAESLAEKERIRSHADYQKTYAEELRKLNPKGEKLDPKTLAEQSNQAQENADAEIKQQEADARQAETNARNAERDKAIELGDYHDVLAQMILDNPSIVDDPDLDKKVTMAAVAKMNAREATEAKKGGPSSGPDSGPAVDVGNAETGNTAVSTESGSPAEAIAAQSADIMNVLGIDTTTEDGKQKQRAIEAAIKALSSTGTEGETGGIDVKSPLWKQVLAVIAALVAAGIMGTVTAAGTSVKATRET